jgi:hypothetical protein
VRVGGKGKSRERFSSFFSPSLLFFPLQRDGTGPPRKREERGKKDSLFWRRRRSRGQRSFLLKRWTTEKKGRCGRNGYDREGERSQRLRPCRRGWRRGRRRQAVSEAQIFALALPIRPCVRPAGGRSRGFTFPATLLAGLLSNAFRGIFFASSPSSFVSLKLERRRRSLKTFASARPRSRGQESRL